MATAAQQAKRNQQIVVARAKGDSIDTIARRHQLTPTRIGQILAHESAVIAGADGPDPVAVALERRAQYQDIFEKALALFESTPDTNPSPKVGALRLALATLDRCTAWDQTIGVLPERLGVIHENFEISQFVKSLLGALEEIGIEEEQMAKVIESVSEPPARADGQLEAPRRQK